MRPRTPSCEGTAMAWRTESGERWLPTRGVVVWARAAVAAASSASSAFHLIRGFRRIDGSSGWLRRAAARRQRSSAGACRLAGDARDVAPIAALELLLRDPERPLQRRLGLEPRLVGGDQLERRVGAEALRHVVHV